MISTASPRPLIGVPGQNFIVPPNKQIAGARTTYLQAVQQAGGAPFLIPLALGLEATRRLFDMADGILLPGGPDICPSSYGESQHALLGSTDPQRDTLEIQLARWAAAENKPILGVCRGHQVLNVALGGSMYQDVQLIAKADRHDFRGNGYARDLRAHRVRIDAASRLAKIVGTECEVNSLHHQAIKTLGAGVQVVGRSPGGVIEAIEVSGHPYAVGVQWHPEELINDPAMLGLFREFVQTCATMMQRHRQYEY